MWTNPAVHHPCRLLVSLLFVILLFPQETNAQKRVEGTAVVQVEDKEYTVPIECDDASRPELGFSMEPSRITRERTGRASMINVRIRPFGEEDEVIVSLDRYVAWLPQPASAGGTLKLTLDMSPMGVLRDGQQKLLTRDMWMSGDRPEGLKGVTIEAQCNTRDPEAPSFRKIE